MNEISYIPTFCAQEYILVAHYGERIEQTLKVIIRFIAVLHLYR